MPSSRRFIGVGVWWTVCTVWISFLLTAFTTRHRDLARAGAWGGRRRAPEASPRDGPLTPDGGPLPRKGAEVTEGDRGWSVGHQARRQPRAPDSVGVTAEAPRGRFASASTVTTHPR